MQIQIETLNLCNAQCCFCTYSSMQRKKGIMGMELFRKIIDDAATIPILDQITLNGLGEPLLDSLLVDRIKYIRKSMRSIMVDFYTNGSLLNKELCDRLKGVGISRIFISLNAVRQKTREEIMGLKDFDKVVTSAKYLEEIGVPIKVLITVNSDLLEPEDGDTLVKMFPKSHFLHHEMNWAGKTGPSRISKSTPCSRALNQFMILWDGRVSLCCLDGEGEVIFGDLNKQKIRDVYDSPEYRYYRESHCAGKRSELKLCGVCTGG